MKETFMKYKWYFISGIVIALIFIILGICSVISLHLAIIIPAVIVLGGGGLMIFGNKSSKPVDPIPTETKPQLLENDYFKFTVSSVTVKNETDELPRLINVKNLNVIYSSTNNNVATIDQNGNVEIKCNGTTIIKAIFSGNDEYYAKDTAYVLVVNIEKPEPVDISDEDFKYEFDFVKITDEKDYSLKLPKLINNKHLEGVRLISSDHNVARFDKYGNVVIGENGRAVITSIFEGNDEYNYKEASYEIVVDIIRHKDEVNDIIKNFKSFADIKENTTLWNYLIDIYNEAYSQFYNNRSLNNIPLLYKEENFPNIYNYYGDKGDDNDGFKSMIGWIFALIITELMPYKRADILKVGYELGGYDRYSNIYGYKFKADPNIARLVGSAIYATFRSKKNPDFDVIREEIGGYKYSKTLQKLYDDYNRNQVEEKQFFTDFSKFMPSAPGPYDYRYTTRPDNTYPNENKESNKNLSVDLAIHEMIVNNYNLDNSTYFNRTVQAIADKEWDANHLYGDNITYKQYTFHPVFGIDTIGVRLNPKGSHVKLVDLVKDSASAARGILQSTKTDPKTYGRLRPGCSWEKECTKHSTTDDRYNVLCNFDIEDNDGCETGYYNKSGKWVYPEVKSESDFNEYFKKQIYANSYPSGHSSGIWSAAMVLMELMPDKANKIMKAANDFAINRTISRFHWTSDTINGRVIGSAQNAVCHAASDWEQLLTEAKKDI